MFSNQCKQNSKLHYDTLLSHHSGWPTSKSGIVWEDEEEKVLFKVRVSQGMSRHPKENASKENLPFLDCIISFNEKRKIITKVYGKPTHTGWLTHFSSNQPLHVKLSTIKTLVRRAKFICIISLFASLHHKFQ